MMSVATNAGCVMVLKQTQNVYLISPWFQNGQHSLVCSSVVHSVNIT